METKFEYDFTLEVPAPNEAIDALNNIVNKHANKVWSCPALPMFSDNDETDIMAALFGIARLAEINVRISWQTFCVREVLSEDSSPNRYKDVINLVDKYFKNDPIHWLFQNAMTIADGMLHGDFYQAFVQSQKAYDQPDLNLVQTQFVKQTIATFSMSNQDLNIDARTGTVTTSTGELHPHMSYVPSKTKAIHENFVAFYVAALFFPVYDVLLTAFGRAYHFRKCIEFGKLKASSSA